MSRFWTSDLHFGHANIIKYCKRPYTDVDEMNKDITRVWNETIKPEDTVYVIGDFSLSAKLSTQVLPLLNGTKILIVGNHDKPFKYMYKQNEEYSKEKTDRIRDPKCEQYLQDGWQSLHKDLRLTLRDGTNVLLAHFPFAPKDSTKGYDVRYLDKRPIDDGTFLLCGHQHGRFIKDNNMLDVGWDAHNGKILCEDEVIAYIKDERTYIPSHISEWYKTRNEFNDNY